MQKPQLLPHGPRAAPSSERSRAVCYTGSMEAKHLANIAEEMRMGRWARGMPAKYAARHGLKVGEVREVARQAAAVVSSEFRDQDMAVTSLASRVETIFEESAAEGDRRHALAAAHLLARLTGAYAADRVETTVQEVSATPAEAARLMAERFRSVPEAADGSNDQ